MMLTIDVASLALGAAGGALTLYVWGVWVGYIPLLFGPEDPRWSRKGYLSDPAAAAALSELESSPDWAFEARQPSSRNFLAVAASTPERRVLQRVFWNEKAKAVRVIVHFGADLEGPPGCVHGGCSAAVADAIMGRCAFKATRRFAVTANLDVNYRRKMPLGTTAVVDARLVKHEGRKITIGRYRLFALNCWP